MPESTQPVREVCNARPLSNTVGLFAFLLLGMGLLVQACEQDGLVPTGRLWPAHMRH